MNHRSPGFLLLILAAEMTAVFHGAKLRRITPHASAPVGQAPALFWGRRP